MKSALVVKQQGCVSSSMVRCAPRYSTGVRLVVAHRPPRRSLYQVRAQQQPDTEADDASGYTSDGPPPGCSRYTIAIRKPLGLVLEERKSGVTTSIIVAEIVPGGNADKTGLVSVGDTLVATSGYTRTTEQTYNDITVRGGEQIVRLPTRNEKFDAVMAAISSMPGNFDVQLEFQRCE